MQFFSVAYLSFWPYKLCLSLSKTSVLNECCLLHWGSITTVDFEHPEQLVHSFLRQSMSWADFLGTAPITLNCQLL